ncbi:YtxH domain-containing protein [Candidatus Roizmanbacteria bacterium]|nr:YtxH domain-containing protein [Candidatus Roizmanbacteria bacterium]
MKNEPIHQQHTGGYLGGLIMGFIVGGIVGYVFSGPDGRKKAKKLLEKGQELLGDLEEKVDDSKEHMGDKITHYVEQYPAFSDHIKKRFFKKGGRELNALW